MRLILQLCINIVFRFQRQEVFFDCSKNATIKKKLKNLSAVEPSDSRMVWRTVTEAIRKNDAEGAASGKHAVSVFVNTLCW